MLGALTVLLVYQLAGEVLVQLTGLPVPGPVVGMLLLFLTLATRRRVAEPLRETSQQLLSHLSLLFVPAGVGVYATASSGSGHWFAILASLVASTALTLAVTGLLLRGLEKKGADA